jgi:hypothetical protein
MDYRKFQEFVLGFIKKHGDTVDHDAASRHMAEFDELAAKERAAEIAKHASDRPKTDFTRRIKVERSTAQLDPNAKIRVGLTHEQKVALGEERFNTGQSAPYNPDGKILVGLTPEQKQALVEEKAKQVY